MVHITEQVCIEEGLPSLGITFALDNLLPEAMILLISRYFNLSYEISAMHYINNIGVKCPTKHFTQEYNVLDDVSGPLSLCKLKNLN
ncbi:hypothetical protein EMCRGX_G014030 [Ephydatia muelleri]